MNNFNEKSFATKSHNEDLDSIFIQDSEDFDEKIFENRDLAYDIRAYFRYFRKKLRIIYKDRFQKSFTNIMYLTLDCPTYTANSSRDDNPLEYICEMRKQYPNYDIRVLVPIINLENDFRPSQKLEIEIDNKTKLVEKTGLKFTFFIQNRIQGAILYKYPKNKYNVQVYGVYSPAFSRCKNPQEMSKLLNLAPFLKAARIAIKKFNKEKFVPDIVHCENIPYYLGAEFEFNFLTRTKVLQSIKDFIQIDIAKSEAFWAAINLADKKAMKKICKDNVVKKCLATLFNLHSTKRFYQMRECINFIYKNYYKFRKFVDKGDDIDENVIFNKLNSRIVQIFPNIVFGEDLYYNPMINTIKKCDYWTTVSKTYYDEILENSNLSGKMFKIIEKTKDKSDFLYYGCDLNNYPRVNTRDIYQCFNVENFRELRKFNKKAILKEFSEDRIKTNFVDPTLFKGENVKIVGSLDSFYDSPILFANPNTEIFANGTDILFNTILKLFELHKNIQVIICIKDGLKLNFVNNWIDFLSQNKYLKGRWVFIDGDINKQKFLAASDMILIPRRANMTTQEHYLAMNYGCVPVVSRSGILNDTISDIFDDITNGCGFKTKVGLLTEEDTNEVFLSPVIKALNLYQNNPSSWNLLIKNCLNHPSGWSFKILEKYNQIYKKVM